ncbi:MAG: alpha-1,4-glucan--maltose-1-phosphate maltosyltransferase [Elusimicrobia bacterium]|nr:alpha-1,4-glucan--maltose-1-phosphate maltosyltransferase [Elusimicrobiota bacterium]
MEKRIIIEKVKPEINEGLFPVKRIVGEKLKVVSHIYCDGHDLISAQLAYKIKSEKKWNFISMSHRGNDEWEAEFVIEKEQGSAECRIKGLCPSDGQGYVYFVRAWIDNFKTHKRALAKKAEAGQDISVEMDMILPFIKNKSLAKGNKEAVEIKKFLDSLILAETDKEKLRIILNPKLSILMSICPETDSLVKYPKILEVLVERKRAAFSSWYEMFPRSCGEGKKHGTFKDCEKLLPYISDMGFDVIYLPPIHPIGVSNRKGKNNSVVCRPSDPGSPWAIGLARGGPARRSSSGGPARRSSSGGHKSVHPELGNLADFKNFVKAAKKFGIEIALDLAYQCSPDHPYIKEHPDWFKWRSDKTIQYAENPPKKYEDIVPINFDTKDSKALRAELKSVADFWIKAGIKIFRVDNPHTKPFGFWKWLIKEIRSKNPDVIFLAEAFTKPKPMYMLAKAGFTQSYTYFTWRNTKKEITDYMEELTKTEAAEFFRPNFWPNTPDILSETFQKNGRPAFVNRFILAATLSSNYGIYGPAYELCADKPLVEGKEEYLDSDKYEIKDWDRNKEGNISDLIKRVNLIRKENTAFQKTGNIEFIETDNEMIIAYLKMSEDKKNSIITAVNLDCVFKQSAWINVPLEKLGIEYGIIYTVKDLLTGAEYRWNSSRNYVELDPQAIGAHILSLKIGI